MKIIELFDEIWTFIEEKLNTTVPPYLKYILKYCGFNNGISIASIDDEDIEHCVREVKNGNVGKYYESLVGEKDVLEGSLKTTANFEFSRGHIKFLKSIVEFLKKHAEQNGPDSFVTTKKKKIAKNKKTDAPSALKKKVKYSHNNNMRSPLEISSGMKEDVGRHTKILCNKLTTTLKSLTPKLYGKVSLFIKFILFVYQ